MTEKIIWSLQGPPMVSTDPALPPNTITELHWQVHVTDDPDEGRAYGMVALKYEGETGFIPFDQLTPENIEAFVKDALGDKEVERYIGVARDEMQRNKFRRLRLAGDTDAAKAMAEAGQAPPQMVQPLPWQTPPVAPSPPPVPPAQTTLPSTPPQASPSAPAPAQEPAPEPAQQSKDPSPTAPETDHAAS